MAASKVHDRAIEPTSEAILHSARSLPVAFGHPDNKLSGYKALLLSTLTTKQHICLDVIVGTLSGSLAAMFSYYHFQNAPKLFFPSTG
jgi:hypothetical protein